MTVDGTGYSTIWIWDSSMLINSKNMLKIYNPKRWFDVDLPWYNPSKSNLKILKSLKQIQGFINRDWYSEPTQRSPFSKKSPTGPSEWTPKPEYLIALATYLGVRW